MVVYGDVFPRGGNGLLRDGGIKRGWVSCLEGAFGNPFHGPWVGFFSSSFLGNLSLILVLKRKVKYIHAWPGHTELMGTMGGASAERTTKNPDGTFYEWSPDGLHERGPRNAAI